MATHLLTVMAHLELEDREPISSETLAKSVHGNPIVVRRLLGALRDAGLILAHAGCQGGATLARPASTITLFEVLCAVDDPNVFGFGRRRPHKSCPIGASVNERLARVFQNVEGVVAEELSKTRISDLVAHIGVKRSLSR